MVRAVITHRDHRVETLYVNSMADLVGRIRMMGIVELAAKEVPMSYMRQGKTG